MRRARGLWFGSDHNAIQPYTSTQKVSLRAGEMLQQVKYLQHGHEDPGSDL